MASHLPDAFHDASRAPDLVQDVVDVAPLVVDAAAIWCAATTRTVGW
jgi:hypothetical protein